MHLNPQDLRVTALVLIVVLMYGSRFSTGSATQTADGLVFPRKPMVILSRVAAVLIYIGFAVALAVQQHAAVPPWFYLVFVLAVGLGLLQYPGTITLGPDAVTQSFWFFKAKRIGYREVMTLQRFAAGRAVRVVGDNRTIITHTNNHAAAQVFLDEMARRTGKTVQG